MFKCVSTEQKCLFDDGVSDESTWHFIEILERPLVRIEEIDRLTGWHSTFVFLVQC